MVKTIFHERYKSAHPWSPALSQRAHTIWSCSVSLSSSPGCLAAPGVGLALPPRHHQLYPRPLLQPNQEPLWRVLADHQTPGITSVFLPLATSRDCCCSRAMARDFWVGAVWAAGLLLCLFLRGTRTPRKKLLERRLFQSMDAVSQT